MVTLQFDNTQVLSLQFNTGKLGQESKHTAPALSRVQQGTTWLAVCHNERGISERWQLFHVMLIEYTVVLK